MKDKVKFVLNIAAAVFAAAAVVCISVSVTVMFRPLYYFDIGHLGIAESSGLSEDVIKLNYDALIDYNLLGGPDELVFPTMRMSEQGRIHFEEVKDIFISMQLISIGAIILLLLWTVLKLKGRKVPFRWTGYTGKVALTAVLVVAAAVLIDWNWAFTAMHRVFFRNDYWIFNSETDPVINILPEGFFLHCGVMIIVISLIQIAILQLVYRRLKNERKEL